MTTHTRGPTGGGKVHTSEASPVIKAGAKRYTYFLFFLSETLLCIPQASRAAYYKFIFQGDLAETKVISWAYALGLGRTLDIKRKIPLFHVRVTLSDIEAWFY